MNRVQILVKSFGRLLNKNAPLILTGMGIAGTVGTAVLAAKAAPKALEALNMEEVNRGLDAIKDGEEAPNKLPLLDVVKISTPYYLPAILSGAATIGCIIGAQSINHRRQAAIMGAYSIAAGALEEYQDKVVAQLGEAKDRKVRDAIAQDKIEKNPDKDWDSKDIDMSNGQVRCFDTMTGRYFWSSMEEIKSAQNDVNAMIINGDDYASLNDFYDRIGLDNSKMGDMLGFSTSNLIDLDFSTVLAPNGTPCLAVGYRALPKTSYFRLA